MGWAFILARVAIGQHSYWPAFPLAHIPIGLHSHWPSHSSPAAPVARQRGPPKQLFTRDVSPLPTSPLINVPISIRTGWALQDGYAVDTVTGYVHASL